MPDFATDAGAAMYDRARLAGWNTPSWDEKDVGANGVTPSEGQFLYGLVRMLQPDLILEVGTSHGFSTIFLATACRDNSKGHIYTVEIDEQRQKSAITNIDVAGLSDYVSFRTPADTRLKPLDHIFDVVFLDAGHEAEDVREYLNAIESQLAPRGVVAIHDALWKDHVNQAANVGWQRIFMNTASAFGMALLQRK